MKWNTNYDVINMLINGKSRMNPICFKKILIIGSWSIRNHRNGITFENQQICMNQCRRAFKDTFQMVMVRAKLSLKDDMQEWLDTLQTLCNSFKTPQPL